jgi:hypothetical protein
LRDRKRMNEMAMLETGKDLSDIALCDACDFSHGRNGNALRMGIKEIEDDGRIVAVGHR